MTRNTWLGAIVVMGALLTAVAAKGPDDGRRGKDMIQVLDLTAEQQQSMRALRTEHRKAMVRLTADHELARIDLEEVMGQRKPDTKTVNKAVARVQETQGKILASRVAQRVAVAGLLTDEQFQRFQDLRPHHARGERDRPGRGGLGRGGPGRGGSVGGSWAWPAPQPGNP